MVARAWLRAVNSRRVDSTNKMTPVMDSVTVALMATGTPLVSRAKASEQHIVAN